MDHKALTEAIIGAAIEVHRTLKGVNLDCGYRLDLVVMNEVVVEVKAVDSLQAVHEAQLLTYLKLGGWKVGLLINFNVELLHQGIKRRVLGLKE